MFKLTLVDLEYETSVYIWEFEMIVVKNESFEFISARYTIKFTKHNETVFLMNSDTLICIWVLVCPIGMIEVLNSRKCCFWLYFSSLHDYWPPSTWNTLVHTSCGDTERCEKRAFQLLKMRKKKIIWNMKTKCVTEFYWQVFEYEGLYLSLRGEHIKDKRLH